MELPPQAIELIPELDVQPTDHLVTKRAGTPSMEPCCEKSLKNAP
jgi:hypothetical protein